MLKSQKFASEPTCRARQPPTHLGKLVLGTTRDLGHAKTSQLDLKVLELSQELGLALLAELVSRDLRCGQTRNGKQFISLQPMG